MQFICESCKAHLLVADEKIRGKRLIVRCKRCGVQIRIVDPLLASQPTGKAAAATSPPPARAEPGPIRGSQSGARPSSGPIARATAPRRETDAESTRAMDTEVLEKALRASKAEDAAPRARAVPADPPPPPARETPLPRDPAIWFAMIHGEQLGPITRAELGLKASAGQVGPRTYLWKEGMESWIRAKDVPELVPFFAAPPRPPPPPADPGGPNSRERRVELPFETGSGHATPPSAERAAGAAEGGGESASPDAPTPPGGLRLPAGDAAASLAPMRPPAVEKVGSVDAHPGVDASAPDALDLARWGAAELSKPRAETPAPHPKAPAPQAPPVAFGGGEPERRGPLRTVLVVVGLATVVALLAFALLYGRRDAAPEPAPQASSSPAPAPAQPPGGGEHKAEEKPASAAPQERPGVAPAPTADQLLRKVDESKPALQGCVDEALKRDPSLRVGKILISTTIAPSGAVTSARIDQRAVDQSPLGACLKTATRKLQFPPFSGEAFAVDIPIVVTGAP
ncbi:MAG: GYF domain-containing protein [Myxococcales bacterium]